MTVRVIWSPSALREIARASDYLMDFNSAAGLLAAGDSLANFPHRGRRVLNTDMRELITDYPYIIRYRILRDEEVRILRVRHTSRQPMDP